MLFLAAWLPLTWPQRTTTTTTLSPMVRMSSGRCRCTLCCGPTQLTNRSRLPQQPITHAAPLQVIDAIQKKQLEHIFLVGGCDGSEPQRKYYSRLSKLMPENTMVLTLGCGKFRIFDQDFGIIPGTGLPRLLDMGQCNDAYSALVVATVSCLCTEPRGRGWGRPTAPGGAAA